MFPTSNKAFLFAAAAGIVLTMPSPLSAQTCPADLEWPALTATPAESGVTSPAATTVAWPESKILRSIITDRHANARTSMAEAVLPVPAVGATVCDPVFGTSITRVSGTGYGQYLQDAFSFSGNWYLGAGSSGVLTAFGFDPSTGKPRPGSDGQPVVLPLTPAMIPTLGTGSPCSIASAIWSKNEENVVYLMGCGTRIFKYNLAAYSPLNPMGGLLAGSNARSLASWPACSASNSFCRSGAVFMDFTDKFQSISNDGADATMTLLVSDDDLTFSGFMSRNLGYKNVQGIFVYRPWNNSSWFAEGSAGYPDPPLMLRSSWQGVPIDRRILGTNMDYSGRFVTLFVCNETPTYLYSCGTGKSFVLDLNIVPTTTSLQDANASIEDRISHGSLVNGLTAGYAGSTQVLQVQYFTGVPELKTLTQPNLINLNSWWGNYTAAASRVTGPTGDQLAGVYSSYTFETADGRPSTLSACPTRNCLYGNEILLFNLTGTHYVRLAHTRSLIQDYGFESYWDLPRPSMSRDGRYVLYSSNWGRPSTRTEANNSLYALRMPAAWKSLLDDSMTVSPGTTTVTPDEYLRLTVTHPSIAQGASLLIQDGSQGVAEKARSCSMRILKGGAISLSTDAGGDGQYATMGFPSSPILQNSQCQINLANSKTTFSTHGNTEYQIDVSFKKIWAGKTLRAIGQESGGTTWKDGARITIDSGADLKWQSIPGIASVTATPSQVTNATTGFFAVGYLANKLGPGSYFEFQFAAGVPSNYSVSLTPSLPTWNSQLNLLATAYMFQDGTSPAEMLVTQDFGTKTLTRLTRQPSGSTVRLTFLTGKVEFSMDGRIVATAVIPSSLTELYLVANMIGTSATLLSPSVGLSPKLRFPMQR